MLAGRSVVAQDHDREAAAAGADAMLLGRITLDRDVADQEGTLNGTLRFLRAVSGPVVVRWADSFGRVAGEQSVTPKGPSNVMASFSFNMRAGLTYANWIGVTVNGVPQAATANFMLSPAWTPWDDFHAIDWAHYPNGYYDQLRAAGVDTTIAYVKEDLTPVLDNNFRFYVEQMAWEIFAIYQKDQTEWRELLAKFSRDRKNMELWARVPCVNDPKTTEYLEKYLPEYVRKHRAFRPLFYDLSDELGQGAQTEPNDFCHSKYCTKKFSEYLQRGGGFPQWDAAHRYPRPDWNLADNILANTTTDRAFESVALASFRERYKTIQQLNQAWRTSFNAWTALSGMIRDTLSARELNAETLEKVAGPIDQANARWGSLAGWSAPNVPTKFENWSQVIPVVERYYRELAEVTSTRGWNVSAWCTFRNFMDETFADAVKRAGDICKAEDPHALSAVEGAQIPSAYGWYNYENVVKAVDVIEIANAGNNIEIVRSLNPSIKMLTTHDSGGSPDRLRTAELNLKKEQTVQLLWWDLFHAHPGVVIWDNRIPRFAFVNLETGELTGSAKMFSPTLHELRAGIGKLFINSKRLQDGIAIHYSQPSIQAHWLLDNVKNAREWMLNSVGEYDDFCIAVRNSWTKLIEDLGLQYNFVGSEGIKNGGLSTGEYKVFVMPESIAVSPEEAVQIRAFVQGGGTLIADWRAAELNGLGQDPGKGQLDDVFGIAHGPTRNVSTTVMGTGNDGTIHLSGKDLHEIRVGDPTVTLAGGKALAKSGDVPMVIVHSFGAGRAIFLNMEIADYAYLRLREDSNSSLPDVVEEVLDSGGVKPRLRVLGPDGKRLRGVEIVRFSNGGCEQVAIFRNPETDGDGIGAVPPLLAKGWSKTKFGPSPKVEVDNSFIEQNAEISIEWAEPRETYDVRGGKSLGKLQMQKAPLHWWEPLVYTRSDGPLPALEVTVTPGARRGGMVEIALQNNGPFPDGTSRVVHLEFRKPSGEAYELYTRNAMFQTTPHIERIPFAVNDPKGKWTASAHDLMTGQRVETSFDLA